MTRQILPLTLSETYSEPSGPCATPSGRAAASNCVLIGPGPAKPSAKISHFPDGLPPVNAWNVTL